jgi:hypothetical protein
LKLEKWFMGIFPILKCGIKKKTLYVAGLSHLMGTQPSLLDTSNWISKHIQMYINK